MDNSFEHIWHSPKQLLERLGSNPYYYRIAYHPAGRAFEQDFHWCVEGMWLTRNDEQKPLPRWLICEEVHEVCSNQYVSDEMDLINRYARHNLLGFIGTTQRISDVHRNLTQACRVLVVFHTTEPRDLEAIRDRFGKEVENHVRNLRPCIYDDSTKICHQEPECLVWVRGRGIQIYSLGDKIKTTTGEPEECQEPLSPQPPKQGAPSLERPSGSPEKPLSEPLPEHGNPL